MGGACSRKREQTLQETEEAQRGSSGKLSRSISLRWPVKPPTTLEADVSLKHGLLSSPSLLELAIRELCQGIGRFKSLSGLPRDLTQQILNELVRRQLLSPSILQAFLDCSIQDVLLGEYPGLEDTWLEVIGTQGHSLLAVDISSSIVTDAGLAFLESCDNLQSLSLNFCDHVSDAGLVSLSGLSNLTALSLRSSNLITAAGMRYFTNLVNLKHLDLERCPRIHGGLVYLKGLTTLEKLNVGWCICLRNSDIKHLAGLVNLEELQISRSKVNDTGVASLREMHAQINSRLQGAKSLSFTEDINVRLYIVTPIVKSGIGNMVGITLANHFDLHSVLGTHEVSGLTKLQVLSMEGCPVTALCMETIAGLSELSSLNINSCYLPDSGCQNLEGLINLRSLNLGLNNMTNAGMVYLKGLTNLESLNLDSCKVGDDGIEHLKGLVNLHMLDLSDSEVGNSGLRFLTGLKKLESLNLSFTGGVMDSGLRTIATITSLTSLNLDSKQITDSGLAALTSLTGLKTLDLFGARITDYGTACLRHFKKLQTLELCGGGITDAGVKNFKDLTSLTSLNLSQNMRLTDNALQHLAGMKDLVSLNVANSKVTNAGLHHLRPLTSLTSLALQGCKKSWRHMVTMYRHIKSVCAVLLLMAILSIDLGEEFARWTSGNFAEYEEGVHKMKLTRRTPLEGGGEISALPHPSRPHEPTGNP